MRERVPRGSVAGPFSESGSKSPQKMRTLLVTGGAGFIGGEFVRQVLREEPGTRVVNLDKLTYAGNLDSLAEFAADDRHRFVQGDICDGPLVKSLLTEYKPDAIVHFAAESHVDRSIDGPRIFLETNVLGTFTLLQEARGHWSALEADTKAAFRFLHVSTDEVYGSLGDTGLFTETTPYDPHSPYSASKIGADMMAESFYRSFELPVAICRPFNTYGPRQSARAVIPTIISQLASGHKKLKLGSLSPVRDLTYVSDTVDGFIKMALSDASIGEVINLGTGSGITIGELAKKIMKIMDLDVEIVADDQRLRPEKSEVRNLISDNSKARSVIKWTPQVNVDEGLTRTVKFVSENMIKYKSDIYNK